jgi:hypothetical protein
MEMQRKLRKSGVLTFALVVLGPLAEAGAAEAVSEFETQTVVQGSAEHPRNGEADVICLRSGNLLLVYGRWNKSGGGGDFGEAELWSKTSHDGGKTWGEDRVIVPNEGKVTTFEAGLLRLPGGAILLSYCVKNSTEDCSLCFRKSPDEGRTWVERYKYEIPKKYSGYTGINNARLVQLKSGRVLLPAYDGWVRGTVIVSFVLYSDDQGKTWSKSDDVDIRYLAPQNRTGADEPAVIELKDGRVMMIIRTSLGFIAKSYSRDGGLTWSKPQPIQGPVSPDSPASIKRIPQTGDLLLVWNNNKMARRPLNSAISKDEGETWENIRCVDAAGGCYTSITPLGERVVLSYYAASFGNLRLASIDYHWFYRPEPNKQ